MTQEALREGSNHHAMEEGCPGCPDTIRTGSLKCELQSQCKHPVKEKHRNVLPVLIINIPGV